MSLRARATEKKKIPQKNSQVKEAAHVIEREGYQEKKIPKKNGHVKEAAHVIQRESYREKKYPQKMVMERSALMSLRCRADAKKK